MYNNLLIPTDGSSIADRAVDAGIALAARLGARVYGFHVIVPLPPVACLGDVVVVNEDALAAKATENARAYLDELRRRAQAAGVPCDTGFVRAARPHEAIAAEAVRRGCDLIVMGTHGWRGFDRLLLGSETHKLILESHAPVLVVH